MNKVIFSSLLLSIATIFPKMNLEGGMIDWGKEAIEGRLEEFVEDIKDQLGEELGHAKNFDKDLLANTLDEFSNIEYKTTDPTLFVATENDNTELCLSRSIDQFFHTFNTSDPQISIPMEIHFQGSLPSCTEPLLQADPSSVALPGFSLHDRPIDFIAGGLPAAKGPRMAKALDSVLESAVYRYLVGLETTSPLMASAIKQIQTWANQLNAMSIYSYDLAALISPGMSPKIQRGNTYVCEHALIANGIDLIQAKSLCQDKQKRGVVLRDIAAKNKQMFAGKLNVAEKVLALMNLQPTQRELFMNLTGTLVVKDSQSIRYYPPLYKQVIALLQSGKKIQNGYLLKADRIEIERGEITIHFKSQKEKIFELFKSIQEKLKRDSDFSEEEKNLLSLSRFPMATCITLMTQYKGPGSSLMIEKYCDLIAFERVLQFTEEAVQSILSKVESLRAGQIAGYELNAYMNQVRNVLEDLRNLKTANVQTMAEEQKALEALLQIDGSLKQQSRNRS